MFDILHRLVVLADPADLIEALTTSEGVRGWWTRTAELDEAEGIFRFPHYGPQAATRARIETSRTGVRWAVTDSFHPDWVGTRIEFDMTPEPSGLILGFGHRGFARADDAFAMFSTGWAYYLVSLKRYLETGVGGPSPDVDFVKVFMGEGEV